MAMSNTLALLCCYCIALVPVIGCKPSNEEIVSIPGLEGTWHNHATAYQYYNADHKLIRRDTSDAKALGGMVITSTVIHLFRDGGEPMEEPWAYKRHGDTIRFIGGGGEWTILQLTPHLLVTRVEMAYPFADKTDTARYAFISYNIR